jgi:hypothetical protein
MKIASKLINLLEGKKEVEFLADALEDLMLYDSEDVMKVDITDFDTMYDNDDNSFEGPVGADGIIKIKDLVKVLKEIADDEKENIDSKEIEKNLVKIAGNLKGKKIKNFNHSKYDLEMIINKINKKGSNLVLGLDIRDFTPN